jgi:hypothetical protein
MGFAQGRELAADSLRAIIDSVLQQPRYQVRPPHDPWAPVRRAWYALLAWIDQLRETNPVGYRALVWLLVLVLIAIVGHAMWIAARTIRAGTAPVAKGPDIIVSAVRDAAWYASEAARLAATGRFPEAMQADFLRLVLELDARRVTRFHPSKTPSEYVREASMPNEARQEFRALVRTLYTYAYARVAPSPEVWEQWRAAATADRYAATH